MSTHDAKICRQAAVEIRQRGLHKQGFRGKGGSVCIWGALRLACGQREAEAADLPIIGRALRARAVDFGDDDDQFPGAAFNDEDTTTAEDVEKLLLQIADEVELL
jgi:hypothetical protein